jgi:hypothetical protein
MTRTFVVFVLALAAASWQSRPLPFSCDVFSPDTSAASLIERFGAANVKTAQVLGGGAEGDFSEGTVLFGSSPDATLEVYWRDSPNKREPEVVTVRGKQSRWRAPAGITLGTSLRDLERLNRKPFRLLGFGDEGSGTVLQWSGGRLDAQDTPNCRVWIRVAPDYEHVTGAQSTLINQLKRAPEFSSAHPAMQQLNPTVYEMVLTYKRDGLNLARREDTRKQ